MILFLAGVAAGVDAVNLHVLVGSKRRDDLALSVMNIELPAVISAFQVFSVEPAAVEGHTAMRTGIAQRKRLPNAIAPDDQWNLQQRRLAQFIAVHPVPRQGTIPEAGEHERICDLPLREIDFRHGERLWDSRLQHYASIRCRAEHQATTANGTKERPRRWSSLAIFGG